MSNLAVSFTGVAAGGAIAAASGALVNYRLSGTFTATLILERSLDGGMSWEQLGSFTAATSGAIPNLKAALYRWRCSAFTSGTAVTALEEEPQAFKRRIITGLGKVGATTGWVSGGGAVNTGLAGTLIASQTNSTLVIPITGLKEGDTIIGFHLIGQIESAGGSVTLNADLRKHAALAADPSDASLGAIAALVVTADAKVDDTNAKKLLDAPEVVGRDETFYVLLTGTTAAATDIALMGIAVLVQES